METAQIQRGYLTRVNRNQERFLQKAQSRHRESLQKRDLSPQVRIYNRNVYLREAYKAMIQKNYQMQIKQLANSKKVDSSSYKILKQKLENKIEKAVRQVCQNNEQSHIQEVTYQQMCQIIFRTNQFLKKAQRALDVQQLLSQLWLYLKNYDIENEYLDANILSTFLKILMDPKGMKPSDIKQLMISIQKFKNSSQLKRQFISKYPELQQQALQDIQIFNLWFSVRQTYNLFSKHNDDEHINGIKSMHRNQCTFQPQISQMSRIYAQKSLKKYLSTNKLNTQKSINFHATNEEQNQLHQYLSHKVMANSNIQRKSLDSLQKRDFSYHQMLYKRKLQKEEVSRKLYFDSSESKQNISCRKATPSQVQQIVEKMYYVPEKKPDLDYKSLKQQQQLKICTFHPNTIDYSSTKKTNASVNGFQKEVNRLKKGRQEKQKLKEIYQNLGKPKNTKTHGRTPSFLQRDAPKLILQVNIGGGKIQKIKLHGNEDAKIVAKKFINKHSLQNSMLSVLQELIDQNLKNL